MNSETSLVARNYRLQQWAAQIQECNNRPKGMEVKEWCSQHNITKAAYYYRMRKVREACLDIVNLADTPSFIEVPIEETPDLTLPAAILRSANGMELQVQENASSNFLTNLIEAMSHVK